ncbi:MAG: hypothetical protein V1736_02170, partial [Pseudomonadota bacterium]
PKECFATERTEHTEFQKSSRVGSAHRNGNRGLAVMPVAFMVGKANHMDNDLTYSNLKTFGTCSMITLIKFREE